LRAGLPFIVAQYRLSRKHTFATPAEIDGKGLTDKAGLFLGEFCFAFAVDGFESFGFCHDVLINPFHVG